ncbi:MAG: ABC transporter [Thiotrichales bacterium SG8_50]|jgi:branched-chain amino acid transport system ATP-binding protein|nr:MAG: ABC transporter [Thiotrichales bacterium SG8_50]
MAQLVVENIHTFYGTSHILFGISLEVNRGECVCLLGRNGVGKTTTLKTIMGLAHAKQGTITYNGKNLTGLPPYEIARMGIGYVPDERLIFPDLTVLENLEIAAKEPLESDIAPWTVKRIYELFPILEPLEGRPAGYLSGGEQQMLTCGRALMGNPLLMLLDEPVEGLAPVVVQEVTRQIKRLKKIGLTILFAEQNIQFATEISDRAYVIEGGRVRYEGTMAELEQQPEIKEKYLML